MCWSNKQTFIKLQLLSIAIIHVSEKLGNWFCIVRVNDACRTCKHEILRPASRSVLRIGQENPHSVRRIYLEGDPCSMLEAGNSFDNTPQKHKSTFLNLAESIIHLFSGKLMWNQLKHPTFSSFISVAERSCQVNTQSLALGIQLTLELSSAIHDLFAAMAIFVQLRALPNHGPPNFLSSYLRRSSTWCQDVWIDRHISMMLPA